MMPLVLSEATSTHSATKWMRPLVTAKGYPCQWVLWGESDPRNSFAKGEPGHSYCKHFSDMELVLERISLTPQVKGDWKKGGFDCTRKGRQAKGCSERRKWKFFVFSSSLNLSWIVCWQTAAPTLNDLGHLHESCKHTSWCILDVHL